MLRNYILISLRLLVKNKVFSIINILGLATGIACCILITLYMQDEFNYEKGFADRQKIFRINTTFIKEGVEEKSPYTSPPIAIDLAEALPEIAIATRVVKPLGVEQHIIRYDDKTFFESKAFLVDSSFLQVFEYKLLDGNAATAFDAPASVLISQDLSRKIFGKESPLDELLIINSGQSADTFRITGVVATPEYPSHVDAALYMSMNSNGWGRRVLQETTWANNNFVGSYVKLHEPAQYTAVEAKIPQQIELHAGDELRLSKEYIRLMVISFVISVPLGYYLMNKWLEGFAYKIDPGVTVFLISGLIAFFIAWLTISFESFRAANRNPVDTFRVN